MRQIIIIITLILCIMCSGCNKYNEIHDSTKTQGIYNNQKNEDYDVYVSDDGIFKLTLLVQKGPYFNNKTIDIYSTIEYVGEGESINISHGSPYFGYMLHNSEDVCFNEITVNTIYAITSINKDDVEKIPFSKTKGWGADDPDAEFWEEYAKDEELKLPNGKYYLKACCLFDLVQNDEDIPYSNFIEIEFEVK